METRIERIASGTQLTICDIVFIHGLGGDAHSTWQHDKNEKGDYWPKWVAEANPEAAVWTVGYDAAASSWLGESMPISERAKNLLARLSTKGIGERPAAFITHSMGGLITKQMMRVAEGQGKANFLSFVQQTKLIVFISVPHQGSQIASYLQALRIVFLPSRATKDLNSGSSTLFELNEWFRSFVHEQKLQVCSFHEESRTKTVHVVSKESADFGYPGIISIGETVDHIAICKPGERDLTLPESTAHEIRKMILNIKTAGVAAAKKPPVLTYRRAAELDPSCLRALFEDSGSPDIIYHDEILAALQTLESRDRRPQDFLRQNPYFSQLDDYQERERQASAEQVRNGELLKDVKRIGDDNRESLYILLRKLHALDAPFNMAAKSLETFSALSALRVIRKLKSGYDWVDGHLKPQPWFEGFKFNSDVSYCLLDWVPRRSDTGRFVFGYRFWVGVRVGHERQYENVMLPLRVVLPVFRDGVVGDQEVFHTWVLPQLILNGSYYSIDDFPIGSWEAFLLHGAGGKEWWSRFQQCPWPEIVNSINTIEF
jgi:hypothetical protein